MKAFTQLILASVFAAANSRPARNLVQESTCTLIKKCVSYPPDDEHPNGSHGDSLVCELSEEDSDKLDVQFVDIAETSITPNLDDVISMKSTLTSSEAIIDLSGPTMYIADNARVRVNNPRKTRSKFDWNFGSKIRSIGQRPKPKPGQLRNIRKKVRSIGPHRTPRKLKALEKTGTLNALVIRAIDKDGVEPDASIDQLRKDFFENELSLRKQMKRCSHEQLTIDPFTGPTPTDMYIEGGVVDVKMDFSVKEKEGMAEAAMKAAKETIGDLEDDRFGLVMFCFPPGNKNKEGREFMAYAYADDKYSFYNNEWCTYTSGQMHEVGHNLGLAHSGEINENEYGDRVGAMGSASQDLELCYNPQKSYQLGWYEDQVKTINPLDGVGRRDYILNGVTDYKKNDDALVVLRLKQMNKDQDFYIGFNRDNDFNKETQEDKNMVTIVRKDVGGHKEYGQSTKVASLTPGERYILKDFNDDRSIQVVFLGLYDGDARIAVIDNIDSIPRSDGKCQEFTVEVFTDPHPEDNKWYIQDTEGIGEVVATSPPFFRENNSYKTKVCLPLGQNKKTYEFVIFDNYGDGLCCSQGFGFYKVYDNENRVIFEGAENFKQERHEIEVQGDQDAEPSSNRDFYLDSFSDAIPEPEAKCRNYTVQVLTDRYPSDSSWEISGLTSFNDEELIAESPIYDQVNTLYETNVCLEVGRVYEFTFSDTYSDGIEGHYAIIDDIGKVPVYGDVQSGKFDVRSNTFMVLDTFESEESIDEPIDVSIDISIDESSEESSEESSDSSSEESKRSKRRKKRKQDKSSDESGEEEDVTIRAKPEQNCSESPDTKFRFNSNNGPMTQDCDWLSRRRRKRMKKYYCNKALINKPGKKVRSRCPQTCASVGLGKC